MKPLILITRPQRQAEKTLKFLQKMGFEVFSEPMIEIENTPKPDEIKQYAKLNKNLHIILTSANAAYSLKNNIPDKTKIITVGDETADEVKRNGFTQILSINGNAANLCKCIEEKADKNSNFLYLSGDVTSTDIKDILHKQDFNIEQIKVYTQRSVNRLSSELVNLIKEKKIHYAVFFSSNTAKNFIDNLKKENLIKYTDNIHIFCMSPNIAKQFDNNIFKKIHYPDKTESKSLLELICNFKLL